MTSLDAVAWTQTLCRKELQHLICCSPELGPCNLRVVESERRRMGPPEWARFQISAHVRADVTVAMTTLWPVTKDLDWEHLADGQVRNLPPAVQALWVLILMGPYSTHEGRVPIPNGQSPLSRFGMLTWAAAERITRRNHKVIAQVIDAAISDIVRVLNGPATASSLPRFVPGIVCTPRHHAFSVGGNPPAAGSRCFCGRTTFREKVTA